MSNEIENSNPTDPQKNNFVGSDSDSNSPDSNIKILKFGDPGFSENLKKFWESDSKSDPRSKNEKNEKFDTQNPQPEMLRDVIRT